MAAAITRVGDEGVYGFCLRGGRPTQSGRRTHLRGERLGWRGRVGRTPRRVVRRMSAVWCNALRGVHLTWGYRLLWPRRAAVACRDPPATGNSFSPLWTGLNRGIPSLPLLVLKSRSSNYARLGWGLGGGLQRQRGGHWRCAVLSRGVRWAAGLCDDTMYNISCLSHHRFR